jgi:hypothetical protein
LALVFVFQMADLDAFRNLGPRIQWRDLPVVVGIAFAIIAAFGWRWRTLLRARLPLPRSVLIMALGLAGNQLLPLRAGDGLRVVLSARGERAPSFHAAVSGLAMEKIFDLLAVAAFGLASAALFAQGRIDLLGTDIVALAAGIVFLAVAVLFASRSGILQRILRSGAHAFRVSPRLYRHALRPLHHLRESATPRRVAVLIAETALLWMVLYVLAYLFIARMFGIPLALSEAMVLLFAGALGLAIPAAPSGLGTFHAAFVSGFVVIGRPAADGLVLAVAIHGVFFVVFCVAGAIALALATRSLGPIRFRGESA